MEEWVRGMRSLKYYIAVKSCREKKGNLERKFSERKGREGKESKMKQSHGLLGVGKMY